MNSLSRFVLILISACCTSVLAQGYPSRPIKVVVPVPPGGYYDVVARTVAQKLSERLGQPMLIENRAGASGIIGTEFAAKSAPDGHTIMVNGIGPMAILPSLHETLPYDPVRDFLPIVLLSGLPNIVVVHPSVPANTVAELVALARTRPGEVTFASSGSGSTQRLTAEMFMSVVGAKLLHIQFNGSAPATAAMVGGQTMLMFGLATDVLHHVRAGKLRALAVTSAKRIKPLPEVPTMAEAGVPGIEIESWLGAFAPKSTPQEIVARLNSEINRTFEMPDVRERIAPGGIGEPKGGTPEQFGSFLQAEIRKWAKVVKNAGAKAD